MQTQQERAVQANKNQPDERARLPILPPEPAEPPADAENTLSAMRRWHHGDPEGGAALAPTEPGWIPALLFPYRDPVAVRSDYPLFILPLEQAGEERLCLAISDLLDETAEQIAPDAEAARILKDNLRRLERCVRDVLGEPLAPTDAEPVLAEAARRMCAELSLGADSAQELRGDLDSLLEAIPKGGRLLALGEAASIHLFLAAARYRAYSRRAALRGEMTDLRRRLRDLLRVERTLSAETPPSETVGEIGAAHVNAEALDRIAGHTRGSIPLDTARRKRIQYCIDQMQRFLSDEQYKPVTVIHAGDLPAESQTSDADWRSVARDGVCRAASEAFDKLAAQYATLYRAARMARLELAGAYDPARHDRLAESFNWQEFTRAELLNVPTVLAVESAEHLAGAGMLDLSHLLLSDRPVAVLVTVYPAGNPGAADDEPLSGTRFELAYLGISHRAAEVHQSSAARPEHLLAGFLANLDDTSAALHVIAAGLTADGGEPRLGAWLHAGAALEGRAHPFLHYNPQAGATWARRFDFSHNPEPEADWPAYDLVCRTADGEETTRALVFTFADFALLENRFRQHYRAIPPGVAPDEITPLDEYLSLPAEDALQRLPFIWAADEDGRMHRVLVTRDLAQACRDRLAFWRTLQELAGVKNEHVREAVERERERLSREFDEERTRLEEDRQAAVEQARAEAAGEALQRLAQTLLATDLAALPPAGRGPAPSAPAPSVAAKPETAESAAPAAAPAEEEDDLGAQEPYITSALCTNCDDCIGINPRMFVYNANKQATIADASAGTFAQLVQAAEKCPARCIHPGMPLKPDEPDLEALIKRAKPFN